MIFGGVLLRALDDPADRPAPRTRELDYVYSSMDLLSLSAFADDGVRRTVWGESFTHFLPLYLDAAHFEAALPTLSRTLQRRNPKL